VYDWLVELERTLGPPPRGFDGITVPARPEWMDDDDALASVYDGFRRVFEDGTLAAGKMFMANTSAFEPGEIDAPAGVIYTFDRTLWRQPQVMEDVANRVFRFHSEGEALPSAPDLRLLSDQLRSGFERPMHELLPPPVSDGFVIYHTSAMVIRSHLPNGYLAAGNFPVLVDLDGPRPPRAVIVPHQLWPPSLMRAWTPDE